MAVSANQTLCPAPPGARLPLQVYPISFLVTNRRFSERLLDPLAEEHRGLARDLGEVVGTAGGLLGAEDPGGIGSALGAHSSPLGPCWVLALRLRWWRSPPRGGGNKTPRHC